MKKWWSKGWWLIPVLLVVAALGIGIYILRPTPQSNIVACKGIDSQEFSCWQQRYNAMVKEQSTKAAFADFREAYATIPFVKSSCHQIGHVIGRAAALKYKSLSETYAHGDNFCWSGYYHGAVETVAAEIGADKILAQINSVCADFLKTQPYGFNHYNCVHGMGHGVMAVQDDELFSALKTCDNFTGDWQQQSCYSGVFMENVMNEINPGEHSKYLKADDPLYPCTAVEDRYKEQCYLMQTSHALVVEAGDFNTVFNLCASVQTPFDQTCFQSLGRDVSGRSNSNQATTIEQCMGGPTQLAKQNCFTGAVKDFISYYHSDKQGLAMCATIPDQQLSANCTHEGQLYYKTF